MAYKDLRQTIKDFENAGQLQRIKAEVDSDVELSAIMRRNFKRGSSAPACLFENVKGYKIPVFSGAMFKYKNYAINIDAPPTLKGCVDKIRSAIAIQSILKSSIPDIARIISRRGMK